MVQTLTESSFRTAARFAAFYGALFLVLGVMLPFWPVWLESRGLDAREIGVVLAIGPWLRVIADPLITRAVDRSGRGRAGLVLFSALSIVAFAGYFVAESFWFIVLVTLVYAPLYHVLIPLGDSQTMVAVVRDKLDYGRIRLWGSATFIAGTFGGGWLLTGRSPDVIVPAVFLGLVLVFLTTLLLRDQNPPAHDVRHGALRDLLTDRVFLLFVLAASTVQASHAVLNGFSVIHWRAAGLSGTVISMLWAGSVLAEIILFAVSGRAVRRLGPFGLLAIGAGAGFIRWIILAETTALPGLIVAQILHAATFGATYLATMHFIAARAPDGLKATAQGAYASVAGIMMGVALLSAGSLYGAWSGDAFYVMAMVCAVALAIGFVARRVSAEG